MDWSVPFAIVFWIAIIALIIKRRNESIPQKAKLATKQNRPNTEIKQKEEISPQQKRLAENWKENTISCLDESTGLKMLLDSYDINDITYGLLLQCFEWEHKRTKILFRDKYKCQRCQYTSTSNHVHHKFYLQNHLPWVYDDDSLVTLCGGCHLQVHKLTEIPIYRLEGNRLIEIAKNNHKCDRCGGIGYISDFYHVENGICFKCKGNSLSKGVFHNILHQIKSNNQLYNEKVERQKYIDYVNGLSYSEIIDSHPELPLFTIQRPKDDDFSIEDLPF